VPAQCLERRTQRRSSINNAGAWLRSAASHPPHAATLAPRLPPFFENPREWLVFPLAFLAGTVYNSPVSPHSRARLSCTERAAVLHRKGRAMPGDKTRHDTECRATLAHHAKCRAVVGRRFACPTLRWGGRWDRSHPFAHVH
jgi:hypothetical protein